MQAALALTTPLLYQGDFTDVVATGFVDMQARLYDPSTAQFISRDPMVSQTMQPYTYAGDNPTNAGDSTGLVEDIFQGGGGGGVVISGGGDGGPIEVPPASSEEILARMERASSSSSSNGIPGWARATDKEILCSWRTCRLPPGENE